jgi:hypothetical protein
VWRGAELEETARKTYSGAPAQRANPDEEEPFVEYVLSNVEAKLPRDTLGVSRTMDKTDRDPDNRIQWETLFLARAVNED